MAERVGARSRDAICPELLERLNSGEEESATLSESLAIDFSVLLGHVAPGIPARDQRRMTEARGLGITKRMDLVATILADSFGVGVAESLMNHSSDTVRGWAAFVIGKDQNSSLSRKLQAIQPLANDAHFGVREWAWLALRPTISAQLTQSLEALESWVSSPSENIRRFAIEATRPRGVWSKHIAELKESPCLAQVLLDGVMNDSSRYVQDSCGNWLNDAAKSNPQWVVSYCKAWKDKSPSAATSYITRKGLRNIA
ncbi:HEAT repeat domain-containing protein [Marinobacter sp. CHS3-4]|uniref:HEAT repeat domain-containing protein n=1 Tax=Marinobacter sp. CHS3-4 TaxID=3045174 RepID=UPI0024B53C30|nr:HEAT repeat domain-containing protein [Marinobacter sp. CHS3-4]MDI9246441.1 HEAT repeat domain-containing protein [Marinobacter sp. CHS3-4]